MAEVWAIVDENARPFCGYTALDGFEDNSTANVPTEPQENGALYAYDKVPQPSECSVSLLFSLKSSKAPTNYFTPNILRKSWSRLVVSVVHLDALAFPVAAT